MPITKPITKRYYPSLSEVITVDDLPEFLHFAEDGLNLLLDRIHYKNLQYSKSQRGDSAFYSLDIVTANIGLDLPFGMRLVLNPDEQGDSTISAFPISLEYQWEILAFLRAFKVNNFAFNPQAFYELGLQVFKISESEVIAHTLNYFIESDETETKFQKLVDDINVLYPDANLALPVGEEPSVDSVVNLINENEHIPDGASFLPFSLYILDANLGVTRERLQQFYDRVVPQGLEDFVRQLIVPKVRASLTLSAGIEFPNKILRPVTANGTPIPDSKSLFKFAEATFFVDTESGIGSEVELAGSLIPEFNEIGKTGLIIGFTGAKLDLSRKTNIPEADAAGYPLDFMGLYVKHAFIGFNKFGTETTGRTSAAIIADNLFLGTGGVSGQIALESNGALYRDFGSFAVELNRFAMDFKMGSIISCDIVGTLRLGKFEQNSNPVFIDIQAHIFDDGNFKITATPLAQPIRITLPNILELEIQSLAVGKEDRGYYAEVSGHLDFIANVPVLGKVLPKGISVRNLRIWDDGELDFPDGSLLVPKAFPLKIGPVSMSVNNITIGSYSRLHNDVERRYRFFGFDGMINTGKFGVDAAGNGIKYYYTVDDNATDKPFHSFLSIDEIRIDLTIPNNAKPEDILFTLNGYLSMKNPDPAITGSSAGTEYTGSVSFSMPKLKMGGSAAMRLNPSIPSFLVDIGMEMSTPIPLGATGLGIYGFRGLFGQHYKASKAATTPPLPEDASWWEYYKTPSTKTGREGIEIDKFESKPGYAFGAGVSIATAFDSGKIFSSKLFLYLGLPDLIIIQGQAAILRSRIGLDDDIDPPFSALVVIDKNSFRTNLGVNYRLPESGGAAGWLFSLNGTLDMAFFFNNASGWYLNIGKDQPETERVRASILTLFRGYAYLMISSRGFKAGAGARFDINLDFGIAAAGVGAFIDMAGSVSFKPVQLGAFIQLGGYAYLKILWIRFGVSVQVTLAVEAPHPFNISGSLEIGVKLPWPVKKITLRLSLTWRINSNNAPLLEPIPVLQLPNRSTGYLPATAVNMNSEERFGLNYVTSEFIGQNVAIPAPGSSAWAYNFNDAQDVLEITIPLDSYIDIELLKPVKPLATQLGGAANQLPSGYLELLPPQKGIAPQVSHQFELTAVEIYTWKIQGNSGVWIPYHVYEAVTAIVENNTGDQQVDLAKLKSGFWQFGEQGKYNKIRLLSQNMFSYLNRSVSGTSDLDALNFRRKDLFCFEMISKQRRINWINEPVGDIFPEKQEVYFQGVNFYLEGVTARVEVGNGNGFTHSLQLKAQGGIIRLRTDEAISDYNLQFSLVANEVDVDFIKVSTLPGKFGQVVIKREISSSVHLPADGANHTVSSEHGREFQEILIRFARNLQLDYSGDLVMGGYFALPMEYTPLSLGTHLSELEKGVMGVAFYSHAFTSVELLAKGYLAGSDAIGAWPSIAAEDTLGGHLALVSGNPDKPAGFYQKSEEHWSVQKRIYNFSANADAAVVPFYPALQVEANNFAFELTAVFNPFQTGISTLISKVNFDVQTGKKKGYALHLIQDSPVSPLVNYPELELPKFKLTLSFYDGLTHSAVTVEDVYALDCESGFISQRQFKHIMVSVNRDENKIDVFVSYRLLGSFPIPLELEVFEETDTYTFLDEITYSYQEEQKRFEDSELTAEKLLEEVVLMNEGLNKTIQPVWRPNASYAVVIKSRDLVNGNSGNSPIRHQVFGFRTAGPVGHFEEYSAAFQALKAQDKIAEFKLASLKPYIDYERSTPDAMGRFELSKPVFYQQPKVGLVFNKPYMNAMFSNWASYQGMPSVESSLVLDVFSPFGEQYTAALVWETLPEQDINDSNYNTLSADEQVLFLMSKAAAADNCNVSPLTFKKRIKQGVYLLPDLESNRLYSASYSTLYKPEGSQQLKKEVHRYNFKTSLFANFQEQASSFIKPEDENNFFYYNIITGFSGTEIAQNLLPLLSGDTAVDSPEISRYPSLYDRVIYGGLGLKNLEPASHSVIEVIVNFDATNENQFQLLGVLIRNPEPLNDPKLSEELRSDTTSLELTLPDESVLSRAEFIYLHSKDTSSVFITNAAMDIPLGNMVLTFRHKIFDGQGFGTIHEDYQSPPIALSVVMV
ncbi:hypothetical protein GCM10022246_24700 [Pedobacter ginsengiterrae]|uniref:LysM domain-containing protein n=1 Tax=Pedobacter ginsengiterrae TaxID=871696 RepID=A0ABP7PU51_9SPHI